MLHVPPPCAADAAPADPPLADPHAVTRARVERRLKALDRLVEIGMDAAEAAGRQARAMGGDAEPNGSDEPVGAAFPDPGLTFARVSRAIRLTMALQDRLETQLARIDWLHPDAARRPARAPVERAAEAEPDDNEGAEALSGETRERFSEDDDFGPVLDMHPDDALALICRELGFAVPGFEEEDDDEADMEDADADAAPHPHPPPHGPVKEPPPAPPRSPVAMQRERRRQDDAEGDGDDGGAPGAGDVHGGPVHAGHGGGQGPDGRGPAFRGGDGRPFGPAPDG